MSDSRRPTPEIFRASRAPHSTWFSSRISSSTFSTTFSFAVPRERAARPAAPGGALAIYTPNAAHWAERIKAAVPGLQQEDHIAVRPAERVVSLVEAAGFRVEDLFFSASPYPVLGAVDRALPDGRPLPFPDVPEGGNVFS
jgi:hypothetical protein